MFICNNCGVSTTSHEKQYKVVTKRRAHTYPARLLRYDPGGEGWEIVREVALCKSCFEKASPPTTQRTVGGLDNRATAPHLNTQALFALRKALTRTESST